MKKWPEAPAALSYIATIAIAKFQKSKATRMNRCVCLTIAALVLTGCTNFSIHPRQFVPPEAGGLVHQSFEITLTELPRGGCISMPAFRATILLSRQLLEHLAAAIPPESWSNEAEREALIVGRQAQFILRSTHPDNGRFGCQRYEVVDSDAMYSIDRVGANNLIGRLLESGQANVIEDSTGQRVERIIVTFNGLGKGTRGYVNYTLRPHTIPFFSVAWWIS